MDRDLLTFYSTQNNRLPSSGAHLKLPDFTLRARNPSILSRVKGLDATGKGDSFTQLVFYRSVKVDYGDPGGQSRPFL